MERKFKLDGITWPTFDSINAGLVDFARLQQVSLSRRGRLSLPETHCRSENVEMMLLLTSSIWKI